MAVLKIWYPKLKGGAAKVNDGKNKSNANNAIYSVVSNVGHVSLLLDNVHPNTYISWWPDENRSAFVTPTAAQDIQWEGGKPTVEVILEGLDEFSITNWWTRLKYDGSAVPYKARYFPADNKWTMSRSNCSHIVAIALDIGGASEYAERITFGAKMVTPPQLHMWALRIKAMQSIR